MGATATALQWGGGAVLALGIIALLIAPFAAVWVIGIGIALLVAVGVWAVRLQRGTASKPRTSGAAEPHGDGGAEQTPAEGAP